ncbi:MAG TPA: GDSL-type esterase/lipase family protein [Vicinamibacterales bacterium]|nr:GDSL-type esterase/lipase family protein [Vicinamibacterales bacterium]
MRFRSIWRSGLRPLVLAALAGVSACGDPPAAPPPPVPTLAVTCPANLQIEDVVGQTSVVTFAQPATTGGTPPTTVTCQPASGSPFPLGPTTVTCTARDTGNRTASCAFSVNLVPVPVISATRFMAFGDSLTSGEVQLSTGANLMAVDPEVAYPTVVLKELQARYKSQTITMSNRGQSGESAVDGAARLSGVLAAEQPQVLIVLQGIIDLSQGRASAIPSVIEALKFDIRDAKRRGVEHVFVSTLLPQKPGFNAFAIDLVVPANAEIRHLVAVEGARLLDGYAALAGQEATLIGADGLHPVAAGYDVLGKYYAAELIKVLDVPQGASLSRIGPLFVRPNVEVGAQPPRPPVRLRHR